MQNDDLILAQAIHRASQKGWRIVAQNASGFQLRKPKTASGCLLVFGFIGLFFWGLGLLLLILAGIMYATSKDRVIFVTKEQLIMGAY
jgi:hypothetical protein